MTIPETALKYHDVNVTRDDYGGYIKRSFKATGFFRLEQDERWWLVDPLGNAFLSFGINHIERGRVLHTYSRAFWANEFGIPADAAPEAFYPGLQEKVKRDVALLGLNTLGCHTDHRWYTERFIPYVKQVRFVNICHYMQPTAEEFHDVFAPEYQDHCAAVIEEHVVPYRDDPYLLGYSMTDCPIYTELEASARINNIYGGYREATPTWPNVLRNLGPDRPGKQAYMNFIRDRYANDFAAFNQFYQTPYESFDEIGARMNWRPAVDNQNQTEIADNLAFLYVIVDRAYEMQASAIRQADPNHLVFGDKLNGNSDTPDEIVQLADKHFDLIFYQYYAFWDDQQTLLDRWSTFTDKPFFVGDSAVNTPSRNIPDPYGPHCATQELRAERAYELLTNAFRRKDFIGWNWCGWLDQWHIGESPVYKQHGGLQDPFGHFHQPMLEVFSNFSALMYEHAMR